MHTPPEKKTAREIFFQNQQRRQPEVMRNLAVWLHNIRSLHNTGSAFRTADGFGAAQLLLSGYTPCPPRAEITKTALGAEEHVPWTYTRESSDQLTWCQQNHYQLVALEQTRQSVPLHRFHPEADTRYCLLFGNEVSGVEPDLLAAADHVLEIPQFGRKHSLNISVTIGIALYHFMAQSLVAEDLP